MRRWLTVVLGVALLVGFSCGPDNGLSGSLGQVFPLDISTSNIARNDEALQVTYTLNRGVFLDVVIRISVLVSDLTIKPGVTIPLAGSNDAGVLRCVVAHAPGGEPVRVLPEIKRGDMVISSGGHVGELTRGSFSVLFQDQGGDVGFGRTLTGTFLGTATDAGFGELP